MSLPILSTLFGIILGIGIIVYLARRRVRSQTETDQKRVEAFRARQERAVWAGATIISVQRANLTEDARGKEKIELRLQVQRPHGDAYSTQAAWYADLNAISQLVPGATVSIKIDATDPRIIYPNMTGVEYWVWS